MALFNKCSKLPSFASKHFLLHLGWAPVALLILAIFDFRLQLNVTYCLFVTLTTILTTFFLVLSRKGKTTYKLCDAIAFYFFLPKTFLKIPSV